MSSSQTIALDAYTSLALDLWPTDLQQPLDSYTDALAGQLTNLTYFAPPRTTGTFAAHSRDTADTTWTETR